MRSIAGTTERDNHCGVAGGVLARTLKRLGTLLGLAVLLGLGLTASVQAKPDGGRGSVQLTANGVEFKVYTYYPRGCVRPSILFVFHGIDRNAEEYRDKAVGIARETCLVVFAPLFDEQRFPTWRYQRGGVVDSQGRLQERGQWTGFLVHGLIDAAKRLVKSDRPNIYLFGHSAGAQFLSRLAAYAPPPGVTRIVIANPSAHVAPLLEESPPYGFRGLASEFEIYSMLKGYLSAPVSIYLGQQDTGDKNLVDEAAAERQGANRLERGRAVFRQAQEAARQRGWELNWELVEVPGVGHSSGKMLRAAELYQALGLYSEADAAERVPARR